MPEFKPLSLAQLYQSADASVAQAMQMNLLAMQGAAMRADFEENQGLKDMARRHDVTSQEGQTSFLREAAAFAPRKATEYRNAFAAERKANSELLKTDRENYIALAEEGRQRLKGVADDESLRAYRAEMLDRANVFVTPEFKNIALKAAKTIPERYDSAVISRMVLKSDEAFAPRYEMRNLGDREELIQLNPLAGRTGPVQGAPALKRGMTLSEEETKRHNLANEALQRAGLDQSQWVYDADRSLAVNKITLQTKPVKLEGGEPLPPKAGDVDGMRQEFNKRDEVKNYNAAVPVLRAVANAPDTAAGDLDFIYGVGKILDPGSVVREGEMALVMKSGSPMQQLLGTTRWSAEQGGRITPKIRGQLMEALQGRVNELHKAATDARKPFEAQAKRQNIPVDETLTLPELPQFGKASGKAPEVGTVRKGYRFKGGDPSKPESWQKVGS